MSEPAGMNFAAPPMVKDWPSTPGLYLASISCTRPGPWPPAPGAPPLPDAGGAPRAPVKSATVPRRGLYISPSGASFTLPSGAPLSTQATRVLISASLRLLVLVKCPTLGSANQGGIFPVSTADFIALAQGRASL